MNKKFLLIGAAAITLVLVVMFLPKGKSSKLEIQASSANTKEAKALYEQATKLRNMHEPVRARAAYQEIIKNYPDLENIATIQQELEAINMDLLFSNYEVPGKTTLHEVVAGDSLVKIAKKYNTTVEFLRRSNNMKGDVVRLGDKLRIWNGKFNIFVDKSQNILILKDGTDVIKVYTVSTGENNSTPAGTFKIVSKLENPVWFNKGMVIPPESPANVLGTRWMGFDIAGYGIHGTVEPKMIGQQVTAGCVRMLNAEVEELFNIVPMGTEVVIVD